MLLIMQLILKKYILLSKIPVHLEQNPPNGIFFESKNHKKLAKIILNYLNKKNHFKNA